MAGERKTPAMAEDLIQYLHSFGNKYRFEKLVFVVVSLLHFSIESTAH
jgi:hypothetical protein